MLSNVDHVLVSVGLAGKVNKNNCAMHTSALNYAMEQFHGLDGNSDLVAGVLKCWRGALRSGNLGMCRNVAATLNALTETVAQGDFQATAVRTGV